MTARWRVLRRRAVRRSWALRALVACERDGWRALAACRGQQRLYHGESTRELQIARAICEDCPVRLDCLAACWKAERTVKVQLWSGVYGGLTPDDRRAALRAEGVVS